MWLTLVIIINAIVKIIVVDAFNRLLIFLTELFTFMSENLRVKQGAGLVWSMFTDEYRYICDRMTQ